MSESLAGVVERVTFHNEENGFCVLRVKVPGQRDAVPVVGHAPTVNPGESIEAEGEWTTARDWGRQFRADRLRVTPPNSAEGIERYLASGLIQGIGREFAGRLVRAFGTDVFDVMDRAPHRLLEIPGIGKKRQETLLAAWEDQRVVRDIMVFLHGHGVSTSRAVRIYKIYGRNAVDRVRENPYRLARDIQGIGFKSADKIAAALGIARDSTVRVEAGLTHVLQELTQEGHCAFPRHELIHRTANLLGVRPQRCEEALAAEIERENLIESAIEDVPCVYLPPLFFAEGRLVEVLVRLDADARPLLAGDIGGAIDHAESKLGLTLAPAQRHALHTALTHRVCVITGGPGVGKTTILKGLLHALNAEGLRCRVCAPTGRAARRLKETTGHDAQTIHRLLEFNPGRGGFRHDHQNPLSTEVVILDEASMVDIVLFYQLARAIPDGAALVIVGDVDQLPSVGPGQVLADIIDSGALPVVRLDEVFRQAAESQIITNAHRIHAGELPVSHQGRDALGDFYCIEAERPEDVLAVLEKVLVERVPERFRLDPVRDVQVLVPMHRSSLGSRALNEKLQQLLNPSGGPQLEKFGHVFRVGDKVMQSENDYDKEVFNGDIGYIREVDVEEKHLVVDFDGRLVPYADSELDELQPAYACTVHKSQGSEYPAVIVPIHTQHYMMLTRKVLYTAVTRARQLVVLIGSSRALAIAVARDDEGKRLSGLGERLDRRARSLSQPRPEPH